MRILLLTAGLLCLFLGGCALFGSDSEPRVSEWKQAAPTPETRVFGPMHYDEMKDFVLKKELQGWRTSSCEEAGSFLPGKYLIVMERPLK